MPPFRFILALAFLCAVCAQVADASGPSASDISQSERARTCERTAKALPFLNTRYIVRRDSSGVRRKTRQLLIDLTDLRPTPGDQRLTCPGHRTIRLWQVLETDAGRMRRNSRIRVLVPNDESDTSVVTFRQAASPDHVQALYAQERQAEKLRPDRGKDLGPGRGRDDDSQVHTLDRETPNGTAAGTSAVERRA
jgi:hypothetical protein